MAEVNLNQIASSLGQILVLHFPKQSDINSNALTTCGTEERTLVLENIVVQPTLDCLLSGFSLK